MEVSNESKISDAEQHQSDPPRAKKARSRNRPKQPSVIFSGSDITPESVAYAINMTFKRECHIFGIKQLHMGKIIVWTNEAEKIASHSFDPELFNNQPVWTHLGNGKRVPTIGFAPSIPASVNQANICNRTGAMKAIRIGKGFKLFFATPRDLHEALMSGVYINGNYRSIEIWTTNRRCSQCGSFDHFKKNCEILNFCSICEGFHSYAECPKRLETLRNERNDRIQCEWKVLDEWLESQKLVDEFVVEEKSTAQTSNNARRTKARRAQVPRATVRSSTTSYRTILKRDMQDRKQQDWNNPEAKCNDSPLSTAKELLQLLKTVECDSHGVIHHLTELQKVQEKQHQMEAEQMQLIVEEAKTLALANAFIAEQKNCPRLIATRYVKTVNQTGIQREVPEKPNLTHPS